MLCFLFNCLVVFFLGGGGLSSSCVHNATSLSGLSIFNSVSYNVYLPLFTIIEEFENTKGGNQNSYIEGEQITQWPKEKKYKRKHNGLQNIHIQLEIE